MKEILKNLSIVWLLFTGFALTIILIVSGIGYVVTARDYERSQMQSQRLREEYIASQRRLLKQQVEQTVDFIRYNWAQAEERLKHNIKGRTYEAYAIASSLYEQHRGKADEQEIRNIIKSALRPIRFNHDRGYYFATGLDGVEILFADRPELEGQSMLEMRDAHGAYVIRDMIELAREKGEGFYEYTWTKPNAEGRNFRKIAFVKYFPPLHGFIGTGEYLDDMEQDIRKEVLDRISKIRFGKEGYIFVVDFDGNTLMNGAQQEFIGKNIENLTDPNGVKVFQEECRAAGTPDGDFIQYGWEKPSTTEIRPKVSFVKGFPRWRWIVGAGIYADEIDPVIKAMDASVRSGMRKDLYRLALILAVFLLAALLVCFRLSRFLKRQLALFVYFFKEAETGGKPIAMEDVFSRELRLLAQSANSTLQERQKALKALRENEHRLRTILQTTNEGFWLTDNGNVIMEINPRMCAILGRDREEVLGKRIADYADPHNRQALEKQLLREVERKTDSYELAFSRPDGVGVFCLVNSVPLFNESGDRIGAFAMATDITARKRGEDALHEAHSLLQNTFNAIPDLLTVHDRDLRVVLSNWHGQNHITEEERRSKPRCYACYMRCDKPCQPCPTLEVFRTGQAVRMETANPSTQRITEVSACPVLDPAGGFELVTEHVRDITERKQAEERLQESEREKAILNEIAGVFLTIADEKIYEEVLGVILRALNCAYGIFGYIGDSGDLVIPSLTKEIWSACEVEGKSIVFPSHAWKDSIWGKAIKEKTSFYSEGPFHIPEGHLSIRNFLTVPVVFGGRTIGLVSAANKDGGFTGVDRVVLERIAANISPILNARLQRDREELERRRAEAALKESRQRLSDIIEFLPDATLVVDKDKKIIAWNRAIEEMTGVSKEQMIGKGDYEYTIPFYGEKRRHLIDLIDVHDEKLESQYWNITRKGGIVYTETYVPKVFGGTGAYVFTAAAPLFDSDGNRWGAIESIRDMTEQKRAEEALRRSEEKYRELVENANSIILRMDNMGKVTFMNEFALRFFGYSEDEIIGRSVIGTIVPPLETSGRDLQLMIEDIALNPNRYASNINENMRKGGERVWIAWTNKPIRYDNGKVTETLCVGNDITDRRKAEKERENLQAQLNQAQKLESVGRLASGVAHDFNNMLGVILGHADLVLGEITPDIPLYHNVVQIKNAAERSADLTRQLLAFARKQTINPRLLDLNKTISGVLKMLRRLIGEGINLVWKPCTDVWPVKIDPSQVDQILTNLAVNARDAMTGIGSITIETSNIVLDDSYSDTHNGFTAGSFVMLAVSDIGAGMDKATLDRIFEPFFTTKELGKGTGLGLATVYGIVKQNNGFINAYSEPGHGTTFKIYIPRAEEQAAEKPVPDAKRDLEGTETVLLVEDEEPLLALNKAILERHGYLVLASRNPREALRIAQTHPGPIHLLLTDVVMPEMNGKDLKNRLEEIKHGFKCIFMSGYAADVIAHHGVLDEGIHFLQKPFSVLSLTEKIRNVLDG